MTVKEQVIEVLKNGDKKWKHIAAIHRKVPDDENDVRDALADLLREGKVKADVYAKDGQPIFILASRL